MGARVREEEMGDSAYSFSLTTFSPSGKLVQIEYAINAVQQRPTALGIKATNGVVVATEKKMPTTLIDDTSVEKTATLTENVGVVFAGLHPDFRLLVKKGRKKAQEYFKVYKENIPVSQLVRELASIMQEFTQSGGVRPLGVSLLVAGYDAKGPQLYQVDPSGAYWGWKAYAIGKNSVNASTFLEKRYNSDIEIEDAIHTAILTLKEGFEGAIDENNIEIGVVKEDQKYVRLSPAQIKDYLTEME